MADLGKQPVIRVTVFDDGTFLVLAHPEHRDEVTRALGIIMNAVDEGADYLILDM